MRKLFAFLPNILFYLFIFKIFTNSTFFGLWRQKNTGPEISHSTTGLQFMWHQDLTYWAKMGHPLFSNYWVWSTTRVVMGRFPMGPRLFGFYLVGSTHVRSHVSVLQTRLAKKWVAPIKPHLFQVHIWKTDEGIRCTHELWPHRNAEVECD